ncbi:MAG TPA: PIN domain-containing protein [Actinocrinis sp.]|uniref:PIN domain-containing protein n=1 Tax=Actinocrinis sp. TaxID=1920516 RepID=UPI002DDD1AC3|nr:PIN domain-containing protein [Actinocrinis sp.]HEV2344977.1 PIN domain-containing protein [Actinocrinis sp.]
MTIIVDTSAVLAALDEDQDGHRAVVAALKAAHGEPLVVSPMIVAEADYMLYTRLGADAARAFARDVAAEAYELASWDAEDHAVAVDLTTGYRDAYIGVADASNVVLADRYRTTRLLTLDQRHFRVLRPLWGANAFTLLPFDED